MSGGKRSRGRCQAGRGVEGGIKEGGKREAAGTHLGLREDDACFAFYKSGSDLKNYCLYCVGTAPTLGGEQFHANGSSGQHIATTENWLHNSHEGRAIRELVIKDNVEEDVIHPLHLSQLLHILKERAVWVHPRQREGGGREGRSTKGAKGRERSSKLSVKHCLRLSTREVVRRSFGLQLHP